ncbi:hypothetical protein V3C99_004433 [Haemonchus contortus]|uniref:Reverse transcriptase domain-containing protein n=1 Tax=Haemonchus contortus TaxID=6289 RepID=A0A7I4XWH7_HAECO
MVCMLYNKFTIRITPFFKEAITNVKRRNTLRHTEWEGKVVKVDGCMHLHHLIFADGIVLITPKIEQAEQMLTRFDKACGKIGLRLD